jgi:L-ascorbate metabolism protein UlaG (beta-lactamase superfamily)
MIITYYGHACFGLEDGKYCILIDPWLKENPLVTHVPDGLSPNLILVTHGHPDHLGDTVEIAKQSGATIISTPEVCYYCAKQGVKIDLVHYGGTLTFDFATVTVVPAWHSSSISVGEDRVYAGNPCGFVIRLGGKAIYHAGDTCLFGDMRLIADRFVLDYALLPIGDRFTMGPEDALKAVELLRPRVVIPMHYDTFDYIVQDVEAFRSAVERRTISRCLIMKPGMTHQD